MKSASPQSSRQQNHGRTAALVHGTALISGGVALAVVMWMAYSNPKSDDAERVAGVGFSMVVVMGVWSVVLAQRALWCAEAWGWPAAVLGAFMLECSAACLGPWISRVAKGQWIPTWMGLAVFVPFLTFVTFIAVPLAIWRVRRAEHKDIEAGATGWENRRRWKRGVFCYFLVSALLTFVFLPWPLFLFCATGSGRSPFMKEPPDIRGRIAENMPDFIRDNSAAILEQSNLPVAIRMHATIVSSGYISKKEMLRHLSGSNTMCVQSASYGIGIIDPGAALEFSRKVANGTVMATTPVVRNAGSNVGYYGSPQEIGELLDSKTLPVTFVESLLFSFWRSQRRDCLPQLERFADTAPSRQRAYALQIIAQQVANENDIERIWHKLFADPIAARRLEALRIWTDPSKQVRIWCIALEGSHAELVPEMLIMCEGDPQIIYDANPEIMRHLGRYLLPLLDNNNLAVRRGAVLIFSQRLKINVPGTPYASSSTVPNGNALQGAPPAPETPQERVDLEHVRAAAQKWLHDSAK